MTSGRVYNVMTTPHPAATEEREAARRMVAANVADAAGRMQVEAMLGLDS